ncbi:MAG: DUF4091 domain-containing protein [Planctomycetes bacterium]|nr:DUF4091 domain-containing protein [Planctomycetota bacterium]
MRYFLAIVATLCGLTVMPVWAETAWDGVAFPQKGSAEVRAWFVLPTRLVLDDAELPTGEPQAFGLKAGRGEYECAQLVVRSARDVQAVSVAFTELRGSAGRIPAECLSCNKVGLFDMKTPSGGGAVRRTGLVPDPLLPDRTFDLKGNALNVLWLTLRTPADAAAGLYSGQVRLLAGQQEILSVPLQLKVWDFDLPKETHLVIMANVWPRPEWFARYTNRPLWDCLKDYYDNLKAHRVNAAASIYPLTGFWTADGGEPEGLAEYEAACRYVLDTLGFIRFRFHGVAGAVGGQWNKLEVFRARPLPEGIWTGGDSFVRSHSTGMEGEKWMKRRDAHIQLKRGRADGSWVEYDFESPTEQRLWLWLQVEAIQDAETKEVFLDGERLGQLTGADFRPHPLNFARLPDKVRLAAGKHTLRLVVKGVIGVSDPIYNIYLTSQDNPDFNRLLGERLDLTDEFKAGFRYHVQKAAEWYRQRGWLAKAQMKLKDEPGIGEYPRVAKLYEFAREVLPDSKRELSEEPHPMLWKGVNVWTPYALKAFDPVACAERQRTGDEVWLYYNILHGIGYPPLGVRLIPWMLWKYRLNGYLFWSVNYWGQEPWESHKPDENAVMRGTFLYPNLRDGTPVNSIRWESFREGLEDYECLRLLRDLTERVAAKPRDAQPKDLLDQCRRLLREAPDKLVRTTEDYSSSPAELEEARTAVGETLAELSRRAR